MTLCFPILCIKGGGLSPGIIGAIVIVTVTVPVTVVVILIIMAVLVKAGIKICMYLVLFIRPQKQASYHRTLTTN